MDTPSIATDLLPDELIELILSKCDVKFVIRFKSVSKSWHSIISGPRFLRTLQSKLSENKNKCLIWDIKDNHRLHMIELVNGKSIKIKELPYPHQKMFPLRSCNGLILLRKRNKNLLDEYMLWNPFIGKHITIPSFVPGTNPHGLIYWPRASSEPTEHIFYYDPITGDYKVVFIYHRFYAVYTCKKGSWSEIKELPFYPIPGGNCDDGFLLGPYGSKGEELAYFDARDGKVHRFGVPDEVKTPYFEIEVISSRLCIHAPEEYGNLHHLWVTEEDGSIGQKRWKKMLTVEKAVPYVSKVKPVWLSSGDDGDVILWAERGYGRGGDPWWFKEAEIREGKLFISNLGENWSFKEIDFTWGYITNYLTYTENLYMP